MRCVDTKLSQAKKHLHEIIGLAWGGYLVVQFGLRIKNSIYINSSFAPLDIAVLLFSSPWEMYFLSVAGIVFAGDVLVTSNANSYIRVLCTIICKIMFFYIIASLESIIIAACMFDVVKTDGLSLFMKSIIEKPNAAYNLAIISGNNLDIFNFFSMVEIYFLSIALRAAYDGVILWIIFCAASVFGGAVGVSFGFVLHIIWYNILTWMGVINSNLSLFLRSLLLFQTLDEATFLEPKLLTSFILLISIYVVLLVALYILDKAKEIRLRRKAHDA